MRRSSLARLTRASRQRSLPTENCHAALHRLGEVIREYQSDSSSKRPVSSADSDSHRQSYRGLMGGGRWNYNAVPLTRVVPYQLLPAAAFHARSEFA